MIVRLLMNGRKADTSREFANIEGNIGIGVIKNGSGS